MTTHTYWLDSANRIAFEQLKSDLSVDVAIVGGGIAGLTTAYLLLKEGKRVAVIEDGLIGGGETGRTSAHLSNALDDRFFELERIHGQDKSRIFAESHTEAIDLIEKISHDEKIECEFKRVRGYLFLSDDDDLKTLEDELAATHRAGLKTSMRQMAPGIAGAGECLVFENQAQFHPMKYLEGLCKAIVRLGGEIYTKTHVSDVSHKGLKTAGGFKVEAEHIVVATNTPINDVVVMHTKQAAYRSYVVGAKIKEGSVTDALYWDTADPYHYVRVAKDLLIIGGEDHKVGQGSGDHYGPLKAWAKKHFPMIEDFVYEWSGQIMEPMDGVAFIGRNPLDADNIFIITGDSGNGLTHGTLGAMLITNLIFGREDGWEDAYAPNRVRIHAMKDFVEENINTFAQYRDVFTPGDLQSLSSLKAGDGLVLREGLHKVAVYKDTMGELHSFSAVCPHLLGIVRWNGVEKSFDCPCHGSRFSCLGEVVNGPANTDLKAWSIHEEVGKVTAKFISGKKDNNKSHAERG